MCRPDTPALFLATLAEGLDSGLRNNGKYRWFGAIMVFTEFHGPHSFAGLHREDDSERLVLFDVWAEGFGMIGPRQFVDDFSHLSLARLVYEGKLTGKFAEDVRTGKYGVEEGEVCKGGAGGQDVWMVKIKTYACLARLRAAFAEGWEDYWE